MKNLQKIIVIVVILMVILASDHVVGSIFRPLSPVDQQSHTLITGWWEREDITIDQSTGLALVSSTDRRKHYREMPSKGPFINWILWQKSLFSKF
ncbi:MAG: hypothetical protein IPJ51_01745 [Saprospiraceae bacterium]|nr:hypothetical protein [Saprospiraceae bacterium]